MKLLITFICNIIALQIISPTLMVVMITAFSLIGSIHIQMAGKITTVEVNLHLFARLLQALSLLPQWLLPPFPQSKIAKKGLMMDGLRAPMITATNFSKQVAKQTLGHQWNIHACSRSTFMPVVKVI